MELKLIEKVQEARNVYSFVFEPESPLSWKAGQFIFYKIPHADPDSRGIVRHFTIATAPHEKNIMLTSRFDPDHGSSFKRALLQKKPGDILEAYDVRGKFTLGPQSTPAVFIAGGIGITPYRSILLDLERNHAVQDILLLYGCKDRESLIYKELWGKLEVENIGLKVSFVFEPQFIDKDYLKREVPEIKERSFYVSGPVKMVKAIEASLSESGIDPGRIVKDYFPGYE